MLDRRVVCLGSGVSGEAWVCQRRFGGQELYVVKSYHGREVYESKQDFSVRCFHEFDVLSLLSHDNIIKVHKASTTWSGTPLCYMEFGGMLTFKQILHKQLSFKELLCLFKQILSAVAYLHTQHICHRDIKLQNLVVGSDGLVKLIDFYDSMSLPSTNKCHGIIGTDKWSAPEVFSQLGYDGYKIDVWALGILFHYMLTHKHPWKIAKEEDPDFQAFAQGDLHLVSKYPESAGAFLEELLRVNPSGRPPITEIESHPYLATRPSCTNGSRCGTSHEWLHKRPI